MVIFRCDGTYEGILTAVFSGYRSDDVMIECDNDNMFVSENVRRWLRICQSPYGLPKEYEKSLTRQNI